MREARLDGRAPLKVGDASPPIEIRELMERLEALAPFFEAALTTAGYLVLTAGAVWLLFRFAP